MLNVELAQELKQAGVPWKPARGDWVHFERAGATALIHDVLFVCDLTVLETDQGDYTLRASDEAVWRPRLDQLLDALRESGEFVALDWSEGVWRCYGNASGIALAQGLTSEEACARALLNALRSEPGANSTAPLAPHAAPRKAALLQQTACQIALVMMRLAPGRRAPLDWAITLLLTLFALGFLLTAAALGVSLGLRLLGAPVVPPTGA